MFVVARLWAIFFTAHAPSALELRDDLRKMTEKIIEYPLDTVKVRLQTQNAGGASSSSRLSLSLRCSLLDCPHVCSDAMNIIQCR